MTIEQLSALPCGTVVKVDDDNAVGEIISTGLQEVCIRWPHLTVCIGLTNTWESFVKYLQVVDSLGG